MQSTMTQVAARRYSFWGTWFPAGVLALAIAATGILLSEITHIERPFQWSLTYLIVLLLVVFQGLWILLFSGLRWYWRLGLLAMEALSAVALVLCIADLRFTGDMQLVVRWRWDTDPEKAVAEHRRQQRQENK